jgi:sialic acid synthase SpsE/mannose-6-phosphate isomerase-like protein (cupin superfamily)
MLKNLKSEPLFVLDIANNHFGDMEHARLIIESFSEIAHEESVNVAIKFQYRNLESFIHPLYKDRRDIKYVDRFLSTALSDDQFLELASMVKGNEISLATTPFDEKSVSLALRADVDVLKIASASCDDHYLLKVVSRAGKPIIASTGGANTEEIDQLVSTLELSRQDFAIMHCVAIYPTSDQDLNLRQISFLNDRYPHVPIGWSTHEHPDNFDAVKIAAACGARIFERHIGLDGAKYPQNAYSSNPEQIRSWIRSYKQAEDLLGSYEKKPATSEELGTLRSLKRAVFLKQDLAKGHELTESDLLLAIPSQENQVLVNHLTIGRKLSAKKSALAPLLNSDLTAEGDSKPFPLSSVLFQIRGLLSESRTAINFDAQFELSHHYGINRFREFGTTLITCINRDYAKKILVQLPRQKHPYHFHKVKEETFQLLWGDLELTLDGKKVVLEPGDTCLVKPGVWHKFQSLNGAVMEEISTTYLVSDSCYEDPKIAEMDPVVRKTKIPNWQTSFGFVKRLI